ncbi:MAG TPA: tetratricopeptide repeat protein [Vicinamibacterales bacterium]|nr:tetratricopeptide repeat protein [Vicinamibacterales bacterium]
MQVILPGLLAAVLLSTSGGAAPGQSSAAEAAYYFLIGRHLEGQGRIDEAIAAHKKAIELESGSAELRAELAGLYARQDRALESLEMAESALERDASNSEANRVLGSIYAAYANERQAIRPGDNPTQYAARAIAALERAREGGGGDSGVDLTLGRLYVQTGTFEKAVPILQRLVSAQPGYAEGAFLLALAQEGAGWIPDAISTLERLLAETPSFYRGQARLAELYERERRWVDAADAYARAQALNPRSAGLTTRRAAALINGRRPAEARDLLTKTLESSGQKAADPMVLYLLAESQRALGELPAARATAARLLEADASDVRGLHVMSLILQEQGEHREAERVLRQLIARDPRDANALNSLGYMLAERGERLEEAVELLQRALKIDPDNPSYLDSLGWAYFQQGRLDLADPPLTTAAAKLQDSSVVQDHLGDLRYSQERFADAIAAWERALSGDHQYIERGKIEKKLRDARSRMTRMK